MNETKLPVCPYCGHVHEDGHDWLEQGKTYCDECGGMFYWQREDTSDFVVTEVNFYTYRMWPE